LPLLFFTHSTHFALLRAAVSFTGIAVDSLQPPSTGRTSDIPTVFAGCTGQKLKSMAARTALKASLTEVLFGRPGILQTPL
jgi:hypothetical protein